MSVHHEDYTRHCRFRIGGYPSNFTFVICSVRSRGSTEKRLSTEKIYSRIETQYALTFVRPVLRLAWGHRFDQNLESLSSHISTASLPAIPQLPLIDSSGPISALCLARRSLRSPIMSLHLSLRRNVGSCLLVIIAYTLLKHDMMFYS